MQKSPDPLDHEIRLGGVSVPPGERVQLDLPVARLPTATWLTLPIEVVVGRLPGPRVWLSAAIHGDELNGVEIIRRVLEKLEADSLAGAVIAAPVVNVFGFIEQSRYLPDRRDLNRSFPGSAKGSLASRLAHLFMTQVVMQCTHGIDYHTGSHHRINLPQIRGNLDDAETRRCAEAFGAPVLMHSQTRDGSLREAAGQCGIHALLFEGGEPLRFNEDVIRQGVDGTLRMLNALGMRKKHPKPPRTPPVKVRASSWVRARRGGVLHLNVELGDAVRDGQQLGRIADMLGDEARPVLAPFDGLVIGKTLNPLVSQGDGVLHLAKA
jgi:uncharacterized protein